MDMEFPRARGVQVEKSWKFQGVGGVPRSPPGMGGGSYWKKTLRGGYGYFLDPHNLRLEC